jgi:hypothetical protein
MSSVSPRPVINAPKIAVWTMIPGIRQFQKSVGGDHPAA